MPATIKKEPMASAVRSSAIHSRRDTGQDRIVRELDVFLSNDLADTLKLIQYPLQLAGTAQLPISGARLKPRHNIMQVDQDMPALPRRIYSPQEQNFAAMATRTFQSQTIPVETHLCLGKIRQDEETGESSMYLVPLQSVSQMRPTMSHIQGDSEEPSQGEDDPMEEEKEKKATLKPLAFQRKESERAAETRKSSYAYKKKSEAAEEWQELQVVGDEAGEIQSTLEKLLDAETDGKTHKNTPGKGPRSAIPEADYVSSLNYMPPPSQDTLSIQVLPGDPKTIVARLTVLLRQGLPIPYSLLRAQLPPELTQSQVLDALSVCAIMVRGNFCLHSRFVSLPRELQRARTFMLSLLQNNGLIRRNCLEKVYEDDARVSSEKLHTLLKLIAKRTAKGWVLRVDDDIGFVTAHSDYIALHQRYWDQIFASRKQKELLRLYNQAMRQLSRRD